MHAFLRTTLPVALTVTILPPGLSAGSKPVPTRLARARYVALGYDLGDRFLSEMERRRPTRCWADMTGSARDD